MEQQNVELTGSEWSVMECLWEQAPRTAVQLAKELTARVGWAKSTTMTMLSRMEKKGLIGYEDGGRAKLYYPKVEREAAAAAETVSFLDRVYRGSISAMMSAMTAREALSQAEIEELYAILRQAEGKEERP